MPSIPPITPAPVSPSPTDGPLFGVRAFAFLSWIVTFVAQVNAAIAYLNAMNPVWNAPCNGVPSNTIGNNGEYIIDAVSANWYYKVAGAWVYQGNMKPASDIYYAADSGTTNTYVMAPNPAISAYAEGAIYAFKAGSANTGAATLGISGLAAKAITDSTGAALTANAILSGQVVMVAYVAATTSFMMLANAQSAGSTAGSNLYLFNTYTALGGY